MLPLLLIETRLEDVALGLGKQVPGRSSQHILGGTQKMYANNLIDTAMYGTRSAVCSPRRKTELSLACPDCSS